MQRDIETKRSKSVAIDLNMDIMTSCIAAVRPLYGDTDCLSHGDWHEPFPAGKSWCVLSVDRKKGRWRLCHSNGWSKRRRCSQERLIVTVIHRSSAFADRTADDGGISEKAIKC